MKVAFECPDKVNGQLTITVEAEDFAPAVEKKLKDLRKRANVPGFRPGQAPMALVKRQIGASVKMDVINELLGKTLQDYVTENNINMLGEPLGSEKQEPVDLDADAPYTFVFDLAVAPEINLELTKKDKLPYYEIEVNDELIDKQVDAYAESLGSHVSQEDYQENDLMRGDLRELDADGNTLEGGLTVESTVIMPKFFKSKEQAKHFEGVKKGDIVTFNPFEAYEGAEVELSSLLHVEKSEVGNHKGDFTYQITDITRFEKHAVDQELFDRVLGEGVAKDETEFRAKVAEMLSQQVVGNSNIRLTTDLRNYAEEKVGELTFPEELLKRVVRKNNEKMTEEELEKGFGDSLKELKWSLVRNQLAKQFEVKVEDNDVREMAQRTAAIQMAQYGMSMPQEYVDNYAEQLLKRQETVNRLVEMAVDDKIVKAAKDCVTLDVKKVSLDEFNALP